MYLPRIIVKVTVSLYTGLQIIRGENGLSGQLSRPGLKGMRGDGGVSGLPGLKGRVGKQGFSYGGAKGRMGDEGLPGLPGEYILNNCRKTVSTFFLTVVAQTTKF
ncbi:hypothetical protein DPMN_057369 [Dreissena polymorpha]|uniref:Uncharacterized protein n=1 Tax=Dreissena polymorpha TaxID=45954 RepID=A0A9D4HE68_DREPO|nr:hypothetical protein DPMN_057369 [Dreissena polymorpha]